MTTLIKNGICVSPIARDPSEIPEIPLGDYILEKLRTNPASQLLGKTWIHDVVTGNSIKYDEIEDLSKRMGSALTRLGFKKGDILFYVTFDCSMLHLINLTVWRLGGISKGLYQYETKDIYTTEMIDYHIKFVLIDEHTAPVMLKAIADMEEPVTLLSFGNVDGSTCISELLQDDGSAYPKYVNINPRQDVVIITMTSGSTGKPKGVLHTHFTAVGSVHSWREYYKYNTSILSSAVNFSGANFLLILDTLISGATLYTNSKFNKDTYFDLLLKYKPESIIMYPYSATWFARSPEIQSRDLSFLKCIHVTASILDPGTARLLKQELPNLILDQGYGMTECMLISSTKLGPDPKCPLIAKLSPDDTNYVVSTGKLLPYVKAKVVHIETGEILAPGELGELVVWLPYLTVGYYREGQAPDRASFDSDGFFHTGDLGSIDADGNVFVKERFSVYFKYTGIPVVPSELEAVLQEHKAVQIAAVIGVPDSENENLATAFVVQCPGQHVSADELHAHVAARLPVFKHLHGGIRFIDVLPVNRNGKIDRIALKKIIMNETT